MAHNGNNGHSNGDGNGNGVRKRWNQVAATFRDKGGQRGILHHVSKRSDETLAAVCQWPDLLLKMTNQVMMQQDIREDEAVEFGGFFAKIPDRCLLASFGRKGLDPKFDNLWEQVRQRFPFFVMSGTAISLANTVKSEPNESIAAIVRGWMSYPQDGVISKLVEWADANPQDAEEQDLLESARWDLARMYLCLTSCGFVPVVVADARSLGGIVPDDDLVINDPKRTIRLKPVPWVVEDPEIRRRLIAILRKTHQDLSMQPDIMAALENFAKEEEGAVARIREMWRAMVPAMQRWIIGDDLFRLDFGTDKDESMSMGVISAIVDPIGYEYPSLGLKLKFYLFGQRWEETLVIGKDGTPQLDQFPADEEHRYQRAFRLWLCMRAQIAVTAYAIADDEKRECKRSTRQDAETSDLSEPIPPRFPKLGYHSSTGRQDEASDDAKKRCFERFGYDPPTGRTFAMSPPIHERQTTRRYRPIVLEA